MYDDLDRIESIYGSVAEYNRSMLEETYEEHLQSERIDRMEEAIKTADDTVRRWDRVTWGFDGDDTSEWIDRADDPTFSINPPHQDIPNDKGKVSHKRKNHKR